MTDEADEPNAAQLALPITLDRIELTSSTGSRELTAFLARWKHVEGVRIVASRRDVIVVPADAALDVDERTRLIEL